VTELASANVDPEVVQGRAVHLATGVVAPFAAVGRRMLRGFGIASGIGLAVGILTHAPLLGACTGLALSLGAAAAAWWPFHDAGLRAAVELYYDHDCHERAEWKADTGTPMPRGIKAVERWLAAHPSGPGRASLLLPMGRIAEADQAIAAIVPKSPEEAFSVDILRQTRTLLLGGMPDLAPLEERWRSLPDARERRHRRECLALLEAQVAIAAHESPLPVLATARREIGEVYWSMRTPWLLAKWFLIAVVLVATTTAVSFALVG